MEEITYIDEIRAFAKATHRTIVDEDIPYPLTGVRTLQKSRRWAYIPYNKENSSYFIWFSDAYAKVGDHLTFCGAFIPLESNIQSKISIRRRNVLDRLSLFSGKNTNKTGDGYFDSKVVVSGTMDSPTKSLLSQPRLQEELLSAMKMESFLNISINQFDIDFVPELQGKSYISIINTRNWTLEGDIIEEVFERMEKIKSILG